MPAINFPDNPQVNDEFTANGRTWMWTGSTWDTVETSVAVGPQGETGPQGPTGATGPAGPAAQIAIFHDRQPTGTAGQSYTSSTFVTQRLNTDVGNTITGASRSGNTITLPSGNYLVRAVVSLASSSGSQLRLRDVTNSITLIDGLVLAHPSAGGTLNMLDGYFTLAATTNVELQVFFIATGASSTTPNPGGDRVYASLAFTKL